MVRIELEVLLAQQLRADSPAADVVLPVLQTPLLGLDLAGIQVHVEHPQVRFHGPFLESEGKAGAYLGVFSPPPTPFYVFRAYIGRMRVSVRLMGPYKRLAGGAGDVDLEVRQPTLGGVLDAVLAAYPEAGRKLLPAPRKIEPAVRVVLNDEVLQGATVDVAVREGDRVAFVPIVGGG